MKAIGVFLDAYSESPISKKPFWSRDRLVKHEFDCPGLGLGLELWLGYYG